MITQKEVAEKLKNEKSVACFTHLRPDGDAVGSILAMQAGLKSLGIEVEVFCDDVIPEKFSYLLKENKINREFFGNYSAYLSLDLADLGRMGSYATAFSQHKNTYLIDHHVSNGRYAKENYVVNSAANCENVFMILKEMGVEITPYIANCLATGIITDTGNLKHDNTTISTLEILTELKRFGANLNQIITENFSRQTKARAKLFSLTMGDIKYYLEDKLAIIYVSQELLNKTGAKEFETEGFIDFIMGIEDVEVGVCILQLAKEKYKASFRSKQVDVNEIASTFGGGGHIHASGCQYNGNYYEFLDKINYAVKQRI